MRKPPERPEVQFDAIGAVADGVVAHIGRGGAAVGDAPAERDRRRAKDRDRDDGDETAEGPRLGSELLLAVAEAMESLALTFPGRKADAATGDETSDAFLRRYARSLARHSIDLRAIPIAVGICEDKFEFFPKVTQFLAACVEAQVRFRADNPLAPSPRFAVRPEDPCPKCGAEPHVEARWVAVTCRGGESGYANCRHLVHGFRAPDGGRGRHVEWDVQYDVTYPPACEHWGLEPQRVTRIAVGDLRPGVAALAREVLGPAPTRDAGATVPPPERWADAAPSHADGELVEAGA